MMTILGHVVVLHFLCFSAVFAVRVSQTAVTFSETAFNLRKHEDHLPCRAVVAAVLEKKCALDKHAFKS